MRGNDRSASAQPSERIPPSDPPGARAALAAAELDRLFSLMLDLVCTATRDGHFVRLNPAWETVLGYTVDELISRPILHWLHPDDVEPTRLAIEGLTLGVPAVRFENRYRCKDGTFKWLEWNTVPDGQSGLLYGFARDVTASKARESQLTRREQLLAEAQALAGVGSWEWNLDTLVMTWSKECYALLGLPPEGVQVDFDFAMRSIHPADRGRVEDELKSLLREERTYALEYRMVRNDGEVRTVAGRGRSVFDESRIAKRLLGTVQDITEQKRAENESRLLARTAHALNVAANLTNALSTSLRELCEAESWDYGEFWFPAADGRELTCHPAWFARHPGRLRTFRDRTEARTCTREGSLPGRAWTTGRAEWLSDLTVVSDRDFWRVDLARDAGLRSAVGVPLLVDGTVAAVLVLMRHAPSLRDAHQLEMLSTVAAQLAVLIHRRQAEDALKLSEERFQIAARATSDVIYDWTLGSDSLWLSEAVTRNFGHINERPQHAWWFDLIHPDDRPRIRIALSGALRRDDTLWAGEYRLKRADGSYANIFDRGYIQRDARGQALRMIGSMLDISERAQHAEALREAKEAAEAAARAKSQFLANMSHEIRTPLTAVLGFADLLLDPKPGASERLEYVMTIRRNGEHLLSILNDILDLSKVEAGKLTLEVIECSPAQVLADVAALMRVRAVEKGLAFEIDYASPVPAIVRTDPTRLRQVVLNLVSNAIKFTERGSVRVTVRCEQPEAALSQLFIAVSDTGIGMDAEQLSSLFQPFSQADASMTRRYGGSGLGLGISGPLAAALGGEISVESEPDLGSTFTLRVPVARAPDAPLLERPDEALSLLAAGTLSIPAPERGGRVLLAEDGRDNQILIGTLLRKYGFEVEVVDNGKRALRHALDAADNQRPFDVVLMDMQMPELDGYAATAKLREKGYPGVIVALTAHALPGERGRCLAAGCDDYLTKPIDRATLITAMKKHVRRALSSRPPSDIASRASRAPHGFAQRGGHERLVSVFAHDPDMAEIVAGFVAGLPTQVAALLAASGRDDRALLMRLAHQLKGAAGGYGFPTITEAAGRVEELSKRDDGPLSEALRELVERCERTQQSRSSPNLEPVESTEPRRILAIDDSVQIQELIAARLRSENVVIVRAMSAADGLVKARAEPPDLVLLDLDLPDASGLEVCRALQSDPKTSAVPVLFLTGTTDPSTKAAALDLGAVDYVTKPFDATELRARVRSALRTKHYQDLLATRAQVDGLTGLWNRAHFDVRLADEISAAKRHQRPLALAMLDLDHFKRINDTYGHPFGDQVLQQVATVLARTVRTSDLVCRYGGEEFVAILRETGADSAVALAERLRTAMSKLEVYLPASLLGGETDSLDGERLEVTVSLGVAAIDPPFGDRTEEIDAVLLVGAADAALYQAKRSGRDRVVLGTLGLE
ncbi:MAG: hypothetical protein RLZZ450_5389 [Pseudomonadota bacterium]|jgi:diguanylate cyclase (GGDEF)-like protein/PAS domain S-box-containing protein